MSLPPDADLGGAEVLPGSTATGPVREDTAAFVRRLSAYARASSLGGDPDVDTSDWTLTDWSVASAFRWSDPVHVSRAPGRLDVMGGIADYSGSLVLQMPLAEACHVALQRTPTDPGENATITVVSPAPEGTDRDDVYQTDWTRLLRELDDAAGARASADDDAIHIHPRSASASSPSEDLPPPDVAYYAAARAHFARDPRTAWAAYVVGPLLTLRRDDALAVSPRESLTLFVASDVPEGAGVSSSAAVEVAAACAALAAHDRPLPRDDDRRARRVAMLCQRAENLVAGAPCGVMDQMASCAGEENALLAILCRPAEIVARAVLPPHVAVWGIDSGARHSNAGGSDYAAVRAGTFMCRRMVREFYRRPSADDESSDGDAVEFLADVPPHAFDSPEFAERLPPEGVAVDGGVFLRRFPDGHGDDVTAVDPTRRYQVTAPGAHPVREHHRARCFSAALRAPATSRREEDEQLELLGELMHQSHASYGRVGLGSRETDRIVALASSAGRRGGLRGAKITGGGCGGTVCVLGRAGEEGERAVREVADAFAKERGVPSARVFRGSSPGAAKSGCLAVRCAGESTK